MPKIAKINKLTVGLGERSYDIVFGSGWLEQFGEVVRPLLSEKSVVIISNPQIAKHYADSAIASLRQAGFEPALFTIPEGEKEKSLDSVRKCYDFLLERNYARQTTIVALGGGVIGDLAGFVAATYLRGVAFVQIPTSLLAMVDSSVGGKVGVNHPLGKNMIGAFHQPRLVFTDLALLKTLAPEEFRAGFAEVIKHGVIRSGELFEYLEGNLDAIFDLEPEALTRIVRDCCAIKARVVEEDERETGLRAILNYGHTLGHALESATNYEQLRHGEAIAIGMVAAAELAQRLSLLSRQEATRIAGLISRSGLPIRFPAVDRSKLLGLIKKDKKVRDGKVRFVLPTKIGEVTIRDDVDGGLVEEVVAELND